MVDMALAIVWIEIPQAGRRPHFVRRAQLITTDHDLFV